MQTIDNLKDIILKIDNRIANYNKTQGDEEKMNNYKSQLDYNYPEKNK